MVPIKIIRAVIALDAAFDTAPKTKKITKRDVAMHLTLSQNTVHKYLDDLINLGYLYAEPGERRILEYTLTELGKFATTGKDWIPAVNWSNCQKEAESALSGKFAIPDEIIDPIDGNRVSLKDLILGVKIAKSPKEPESAPDSQKEQGRGGTLPLPHLANLQSSDVQNLKSTIRRVLSDGARPGCP